LTQKLLLDILFIYSKLNQDIGYRQGMHEILAPVLWVVERDAIKDTDEEAVNETANGDWMAQMLDSKFVEHDTFTLFCVIMQTAKAFYEVGEQGQVTSSQGTSPIVVRSRRIHHEILGVVDPQLASHLQAVEVLPQIFVVYAFSPKYDAKDTNLLSADGFACCLEENSRSMMYSQYGTCCLRNGLPLI
jgi:TBC1 domain family protein 5